MEQILAFLNELMPTEVRFHPVFVAPFFLIALGIYFLDRARGETPRGFFAWLFPRDIYFHPSHIVDLKLFVFGRMFALIKIFNAVFVKAAFAVVGMGIVAMFTGLEMSEQELTFTRVLIATLVITISSDFCVYWVHRLHHQTPVLWPFHSVHHSAEVMTPVTVYRKHPVYDVISNFVSAILVGMAQGAILMLLIGQVKLTTVVGLNAFYFAFNFLGSNFRHSHIWISYGRFLEHIIISPAQHQVHHSLEPRHHNKNYGEIFAIWDWMFGTLYIPEGCETLSYGISKSATSRERIAQPHGSLKEALVVPFKDSWKAIKRRHKKRAKRVQQSQGQQET